jgi:hypothetical protein
MDSAFLLNEENLRRARQAGRDRPPHVDRRVRDVMAGLDDDQAHRTGGYGVRDI